MQNKRSKAEPPCREKLRIRNLLRKQAGKVTHQQQSQSPGTRTETLKCSLRQLRRGQAKYRFKKTINSAYNLMP